MKFALELKMTQMTVYYTNDKKIYHPKGNKHITYFDSREEAEKKCTEVNARLYNNKETPKERQSYWFKVVEVK